jgi:hypothetical protein
MERQLMTNRSIEPCHGALIGPDFRNRQIVQEIGLSEVRLYRLGFRERG